MDGKPGQLVRWEVDHQHDRTVLELVDRFEQCAGDPHLLERPADLGLAEPQSIARSIGELDQMPNGRRSLHGTSLTEPNGSRSEPSGVSRWVHAVAGVHLPAGPETSTWFVRARSE